MKSKILLIAVIVIFAILLSFYFNDGLQKAELIREQEGYINQLNSNIEDLTENIDDLNNQVDALEDNIVFLTEDLEERDIRILNLTREVENAEVKILVREGEIEQLTPIVKNYFVLGVKGGEGIVLPMSVKVTKGSGLISINIIGINVLSGTTESVRTASQVAERITGVGLSEKDIVVTFTNLGEEIVDLDGPSGGAAVTVTLIAALQDKNLDQKSMMTGTIELSGSIGQIGEAAAKGSAAKKYGATKFYVPRGEKVSISGIQVTEVSKIEDAIKLIIQN